MIHVTLYRKNDCELCESVVNGLIAARDDYIFKLEVIQIDDEPDLIKEYGDVVPVLKIGPYTLKSPFTNEEMRIAFAAAQDREEHIDKILEPTDKERGAEAYQWSKSDSISYWFSNHYMVLFNLVVFIYFGMTFLAPVLMHVGAERPAKVIYKTYGMLCHQLAFRSIFLFGEQPVYPREAAHLEGYLSYHEATGFGEGNTPQELLTARRFVGNDVLGYKVALCQRDLGIYGGILLFGLLFSLTGKKIPPLHFILWILIGILPIALDGVSQIISQPPFSLIPYRESTPFLRLLTGGLFGFFTAWFGYPLVEESMRSSRKLLEYKKERIERAKEREIYHL